MKMVQSAIRFPVTTAVGVLLLVLFGSLALARLPVQMTPTVEEPKLMVSTTWAGASPLEIEREIIDQQEEQLQGLDGLLRMESTSAHNFGQIELTFRTGTEIDSALLKTNNRLQQVPEYPGTADRPVLTISGADEEAIAWFVIRPGGERPFAGDISTLHDLVEDQIVAAIERVPGVASSTAYGGRERELHVILDPARLAARRVTLNQLVAALERENRDYSGGDFDEGKRRYVVRTIGAYSSPEAIEDVVIAVQDDVPIFVRDVARVELSLRKWESRGFYFGEPTIALNVAAQSGANVLEIMAELETVAAKLDRQILAPLGLRLVRVYDETEYIEGAIDLVQQSLVIGAALAILILLLFLRSPSSTLVIAIAIPISIIGTFLLMLLLGRSLNVISLAGMAFAVGMVVDNSIVVLENIYRHRQQGKGRARAAYDGAREVWGAVLASTLTTIAVFVPVLFVREEAGQLFRDIALAIACAVAFSLVVAITVIPSLSAKILETAGKHKKGHGFHDLWGLAARAASLGDGIARLVHAICGSTAARLAVVAVLTVIAVVASFLLMPETEYLPTGNVNFLFGFYNAPAGYNVDELVRLQEPFIELLEPLWSEPQGPQPDRPGGGVGTMFFFTFGNSLFTGVSARDPDRLQELVPVVNSVNGQLAGVEGMAFQYGIFQRGLDFGRNIDVDVSGPDLERLVEITRDVMGRIQEQAIPGAFVRVEPDLELGNTELQIDPDRRRAAELGLSNRDLGVVVSALVDGVKASDYRHEGREIDLRVMAEHGFAHHTHLLAQMPIAAPGGELITLGDVARLSLVPGPSQIRHLDRQRAFTIKVTPPETMPLSTAMATVDEQVIEPLRADGTLAGLYRAQLSGTADKLTQTGRALGFNLVLAVVITYLLMAALFESFLYPFVILFSVPLAGLGGILGLRLLNLFVVQPLDVLTMLGFIILVGTVVNNAILIVHQSLNHIRTDGDVPREAIRRAVSNRVRPIFMSVSTSVGGMLPLVLFPGPGSELYRGLGSVVVGGLIVSTVFTLFLVPALLSLVLDAREALRRRLATFAARRTPAVVE